MLNSKIALSHNDEKTHFSTIKTCTHKLPLFLFNKIIWFNPLLESFVSFGLHAIHLAGCSMHFNHFTRHFILSWLYSSLSSSISLLLWFILFSIFFPFRQCNCTVFRVTLEIYSFVAVYIPPNARHTLLPFIWLPVFALLYSKIYYAPKH